MDCIGVFDVEAHKEKVQDDLHAEYDKFVDNYNQMYEFFRKYQSELEDIIMDYMYLALAWNISFDNCACRVHYYALNETGLHMRAAIMAGYDPEEIDYDARNIFST
jgi:hypothetical protein